MCFKYSVIFVVVQIGFKTSSIIKSIEISVSFFEWYPGVALKQQRWVRIHGVTRVHCRNISPTFICPSNPALWSCDWPSLPRVNPSLSPPGTLCSALLCTAQHCTALCSALPLLVYTRTFTRAHRGSLPTPKRIMRLRTEQEKAEGKWTRAAISPVYFLVKFIIMQPRFVCVRSWRR